MPTRASRTRAYQLVETLMVFLTFAVLAQTFVEDFAVVLAWPWVVRRALIVSALVFDLLFTVDFLARCIKAGAGRSLARYLWSENGWIDFATSLPLLMMGSAPAVFLLVSGEAAIAADPAVFMLVRIAKAVRIMRLLRLIRSVGVLRARRHRRGCRGLTVASVGASIGALFVITVFGGIVSLPGAANLHLRRNDRVFQLVEALFFPSTGSALVPVGSLDSYVSVEKEILLIRFDNRAQYARYPTGVLSRYFGPYDYTYRTNGRLEVFFDRRDANRGPALNDLVYYVVVMVLVVAFLFFDSQGSRHERRNAAAGRRHRSSQAE